MHEQGAFKGYSLLPHVEDIANLIELRNARTLLDYGCGKGLQYTEKNAHGAWGGIMPMLYDPHVEKFSVKPLGKFDGVICTDVLEHIPEEEIIRTWLDVINFGEEFGFVFATICVRKAKKKLPDGRNCHLTVKSKEWWLNKLIEFDVENKFKKEWKKQNDDSYSLVINTYTEFCGSWYVKFVE